MEIRRTPGPARKTPENVPAGSGSWRELLFFLKASGRRLATIPRAIRIREGNSTQQGATWDGLGVNFSLFFTQHHQGRNCACSIRGEHRKSSELSCPEYTDEIFWIVCRQNPLLSQVKLIAEPWDFEPEGYQVGSFPPGWTEWNESYRDTVRLPTDQRTLDVSRQSDRRSLRGGMTIRVSFPIRLCRTGRNLPRIQTSVRLEYLS
jgi:hypothetical protein